MQNSNGSNKNVIILAVIGLVIAVALNMFFTKWQEPYLGSSFEAGKITIAEIDKSVADLDIFDIDIEAFAQDDIVLTELDETLNEVGEINAVTESITKEEENLNNLESDLTDLSGDEAVDKEINQVLQEVSL